MKLDIGCGKNKKPGFLGVDAHAFDGVDIVLDVTEREELMHEARPLSPYSWVKKWPWEDSSVDEVHCSHFLEHLTNLNNKWERVHFFNELHRILKPGKRENGRPVGGFATLIFPHWASQRYYGDPTHKEPFSEFGFFYLDKNWRANNAPHTDVADRPWSYTCDMECTWGYSLLPDITVKNAAYQQLAMQYWLEARQDIIVTITARK